jgi:hypothetical protein
MATATMTARPNNPLCPGDLMALPKVTDGLRFAADMGRLGVKLEAPQI